MATATEPTVKLYEGLFLLNQAATASDFAGSIDHVKDVLARAEAEVIAMKKWDERRLTFEINGQRRGTYILVHFNARSSQIANIERDVNLSEIILRALILKGDHIGEAELEVFKNDGSLHTEELLRQEQAEASAEGEEATGEEATGEETANEEAVAETATEEASEEVAETADTDSADDSDDDENK